MISKKIVFFCGICYRKVTTNIKNVNRIISKKDLSIIIIAYALLKYYFFGLACCFISGCSTIKSKSFFYVHVRPRLKFVSFLWADRGVQPLKKLYFYCT